MRLCPGQPIYVETTLREYKSPTIHHAYKIDSNVWVTMFDLNED